MLVDVEVLFSGVAVSDFARARAWYERFFGRPADVVAHEYEVMWRVRDGGWLYIVRDGDHAGSSLVAMAVSDLAEVVAELEERGVVTGAVVREGDAALKAVTRDPDGNAIAIIEVSGRT